MGEKADVEAFHEQITIPDFLGFLLSHNLRLQGKSGWSPCKNVTARILIHSNTDVWLSKYFYQTQSLGFTFVILPFQCWWWSHGSEWSVWMPQSGTNQAINRKSCVIALLTKLPERTRSTSAGSCCTELKLFGHQDMDRVQKFPSFFPQSQLRGSRALRNEQGPGASSSEREINEACQKAKQEFGEHDGCKTK